MRSVACIKFFAIFLAIIAFQVAVLDAYAMPTLDSSFGSNGIARIGPFFGVQNNNERIDSILVEPSGKLALVGFSDAGADFDYFLDRLTPNGSHDISFGANGRVSPQQYAHFIGKVRAVEQANGAITVAAGTGAFSVRPSPGSATAFRVDSVGVVDAGFKPLLAPTPAPNTDIALGIRPDGRLLYGTIIGEAPYTYRSASLQQFMPDGTPDLNFGTGGAVTFPLSVNESSRQADLVVLGDGSVVFAVLTTQNFRLYKVDSSGVPVATFGSAGQFAYAADFMRAWDGQPFSLLSLADGSLLAGISDYTTPGSSNQSLLAIRVSGSGALIRANNLLAGQLEQGLSWSFAALPDASVVISRSQRDSTASSAVLYRLLPDNNLDASFGMNGAYPLTGVSWVRALAIDVSGNLLVGGYDAASAILARYALGESTVSTTGFVVEFYKADINHYFMTASPDEAVALDNRPSWGWVRTGNTFNAWTTQASAPSIASPVCRFFGVFANGTVGSHFYTVDPAECAYVKGRLDWGWSYEGDAYYAIKPTGGSCPSGTSPVYRVYNNGMGGAPNHRYLTNQADVNAMVSQGWVFEGTVFCGG